MISKKISNKMASGSWIRKMFEEGARLKALHGAENVYDFSLGNPDLEPPEQVLETISRLASTQETGTHGYMNNAGYPAVRAAIAADLTARSGIELNENLICMTVGAAGGLNVALKSLLDPGDEVIVLAPYFVEYLSYIDNHGGVPVVVDCDRTSLLPVAEAIQQAITDRTKAIIINSPNNPSGKIYSAELLQEIDRMLLAQKNTIYVISDEPYIDLVYDGRKTPESLKWLTNLLVCFSWSKSLSLPGERIGFLAISPRAEDHDELAAAAAYCNRTLGFVNAPALFQRVIAESLGAKVDVARYERRRDLLIEVIRQAGFEADAPEGGLYVFMKTPNDDDIRFADICAQERILLVPGRGFGFSGYVRLCFAVPEQTITASAQAFANVAQVYA
ncbi:MAG: pyridoxal phosphate-dependent aminotransferase [Clostridiaceae bacterium]|nr:pyridoxal phosphate-dependent aminotransferase [Clostridiaceae bacterium]